MNQSILTRIDFMLEINMINQIERDTLVSITQIIEEKTSLELTEENAGIMITHIGAMFVRIRENQKLDDLDKLILDEIKANKSYQLSLDTIEEICSKLSIQIDKVERDYIMLHLCTLLNNDIS